MNESEQLKILNEHINKLEQDIRFLKHKEALAADKIKDLGRYKAAYPKLLALA